jgi:predicted Zn-dependent protease
VRRAALALVLTFAVAAPARASDVELSGAEGHPRDRFPLAVWAQSFGDATLDGAVRRAIEDWNAVTRGALGLTAFTLVGARDVAEVTLAIVPKPPSGLMGVTELSADDTGVITLPVRITIVEPVARGQTSRETLLYQVVAHELGHALGLPHVRDPRSLMCCVKGSVDFNDAAVREAYIEARRHPDVRSVRAELTAQYARVWRQ